MTVKVTCTYGHMTVVSSIPVDSRIPFYGPIYVAALDLPEMHKDDWLCLNRLFIECFLGVVIVLIGYTEGTMFSV